MRRLWSVLLVFGWVALLPQKCRADEAIGCPAPGRVWVEIEVSEGLFDAAWRRLFVEQLRASLRDRQLDLCAAAPGEGATAPAATAPAASAAIASVRVSKGERGPFAVSIAIRDRLMDKRVEREIDLVSVPADARALTAALSADELLRASWAELLLADAPRPAAPVLQPVLAAVAPPLPAQPPAAAGRRRLWLGLNAGVERYGGGQTHLGLDLRAALRLASRASLVVRAGTRASVPASAPHGEVRATAFPVGLGGQLALTEPHASAGVEAFARADVVPVRIAGQASGEVPGRSETAVAAAVSAGAQVFAQVGASARLVGELGAGQVLRPVRATDGDRLVNAVAGFVLSAALGVSSHFP